MGSRLLYEQTHDRNRSLSLTDTRTVSISLPYTRTHTHTNTCTHAHIGTYLDHHLYVYKKIFQLLRIYCKSDGNKFNFPPKAAAGCVSTQCLQITQNQRWLQINRWCRRNPVLKAIGKYYNNIIVSLCWSCVECSQIVYCVELWLGIGTCQLSSHHTGPAMRGYWSWSWVYRKKR